MKKKQNIFSFFMAFIITFSFFNFKVSASKNVLDQGRQIIKDNYVEEVSDTVLNKPSVGEMVKALGDPYSKYFSKQQQEDFINSIDNKTCGIGIYMEIVPEGVKINQVIETSPAEKAGIKEGDIITYVGGKSLAGLNAEQASSCIKGEIGTEVNLVIKRVESKLNFKVQRSEISLPTVGAKMLNNTAYIGIVSFGEDTSELFTKKLQEMRMKNPDNYIIDLRNNGGGYMSSALEIAGHFIGSNPAIIVENKQGEKEGFLSAKKDFIIDKPVIFLTNQYTASSSEILSAAVKDYGKAYFIGTKTYGKGVAQQMFPLSDGSSIKLTVEKFYSPKGNKIQKVGISPDFQVKDVDSLAVAQLFSGKCRNEENKVGYAKIELDNKDFEIDLNLAKDERYWKAFKYIVSNVQKDKVYIGTNKGWVKAPEDYFNNAYKFLYGKCKDLGSVEDISEDKVFTLNFNKKVDTNKIKEDIDIQLVNGETGQRAAFEIKQKDDNNISLIPKELLKSGESYYIKVKDTIRYTIKEFIVRNNESK